jgi:hypothetical protein
MFFKGERRKGKGENRAGSQKMKAERKKQVQGVRVRTAHEHPRTLVNILIINNLKFISRLMTW